MLTALSTLVFTKLTAFLASISAPPTKRLSKLTHSCKTISTASTPNDGVESAVDLLANTPLTPANFRMAMQFKNMKVFNTLLYSFYNQKICHRLEHFVEDSVIEQSAYVPGGYVETHTKSFVRKRYPRRNITIRPEQLDALNKCLNLLKQRHIPYLLVEVQDAEQLRKTFLNHPWFEQQMSQLGPYRYKILPMTDTVHFSNSNHLFKPGIEMFNIDFLNDYDSIFSSITNN